MKPLLAISALLLAGCAAPPTRTIQIDSNPPGAKIFFAVGANEDFANGAKQYLGTAPLAWTTECNGDGTFKLPGALVYSLFVPPVAVFTADPPAGQTNLFPHRLVYHGGTVATPPTKIPSGIYFDLTKP